jgi:uncharacterized membrane protein (UPF0127 family)
MKTPSKIARRIRSLLPILVFLSATQNVFAQAAQQPEPLDKFPRDTLKIATPDARLHSFDVWVADTNARRNQGLMFVKSLPEKQGMLFLYSAPQPVGVWMKNTYIPLDILFIRGDGRVAKVIANAKPHSLKTMESGEDVVAFLELKGGLAAKLGIKRGAIVMHRAFGSDQR